MRGRRKPSFTRLPLSNQPATVIFVRHSEIRAWKKKTFLLEVFWHLLRNSACSQLLKLPCYIMENTRSTCFYHKLTLISGNISTSSKDWMLLWALMVRNDFLEMFWFNLISLSRRVKYSFLSEAADRCDLSASESDMCYICFPGQASKVTPKAT